MGYCPDFQTSVFRYERAMKRSFSERTYLCSLGMGRKLKNRTLRKREELVRDIRLNDHGKDLNPYRSESMKWNFKLWQGPNFEVVFQKGT